MNIQEAKNIRLVDFLAGFGHEPVIQRGNSVWYKSPFRTEKEASFKVDLHKELWYDFGLGKGGDIITLAKEIYRTQDVSLEIPVPYLVPSGNIRESDGKIIFPVPLKMSLLACFSGRFRINAPFLQIGKQYPVSKRRDFQVLKGGIRFFKRAGDSSRLQNRPFILNTP